MSIKSPRRPDLLYKDPDLVANAAAGVRKHLYVALRLLKQPGVARLLFHQDDPMAHWELWYRSSISNTAKLYKAGIKLIFGTEMPFTFGNFHHSEMNEVSL